jgi:hypothetical protein
MALRYGTHGQMNKGDDEEDEFAGLRSARKRKARMVVSDEEEERNNVSTSPRWFCAVPHSNQAKRPIVPSRHCDLLAYYLSLLPYLPTCHHLLPR